MLDIQDSVSHSVWLIKLMNLLKVDTHTSPPHRSCWTSTLLSEIKKVDTNTLSGYEYIAHVSYLSMGIHVYIYIYTSRDIIPCFPLGQVLAATLGSPSAGLRYHGSDLSSKLKLLGVAWAHWAPLGRWMARGPVLPSPGNHGFE